MSSLVIRFFIFVFFQAVGDGFPYSIPSKEIRGFFENEALLNKFSGKKLQLGQDKADSISFSLCPHTNIAIQPYQSYRS